MAYDCPLSKRLMVDPVVADDGHTYDRSSIERHFKKSGLSPATKEPMSRQLVENKLLLQAIGEHVAALSEAVQLAWKNDRSAVKERQRREVLKQAKALYEAGEFKPSAEMGYALAQDALGEKYFNCQKYGRALQWSLKAAEQGNPEALLRMGVIQTALGKPEEAIPWYEKCLETNTAAPTNLANVYKAQGDDATAFTYYMCGAKQGYAYNMRDVAECYKSGCGVAADLAEAGKWYKKAAEKGCVESRYEMGRRHIGGVGGPVSLSEGLRYMEWAAKGAVDEDPGCIRAKENAQTYLHDLTEMMARL